eukprot:s34_g1.t1
MQPSRAGCKPSDRAFRGTLNWKLDTLQDARGITSVQELCYQASTRSKSSGASAWLSRCTRLVLQVVQG